MKNIISACMALLLVGCASSTSKGPVFVMHEAPDINSSQVYFYNTAEEPGSNVCMIVTVNQEEKGCMGNPGYFRISLVPGEYFFSFRPDSVIDLGIEMRKFALTVEGGNTYYIESKKITEEDKPRDILQSNYVNSINGFTIGWVMMPESKALKKLAVLREWR